MLLNLSDYISYFNLQLKDMDDVDMLTLVIQEMSKEFPTVMETLVHERDKLVSLFSCLYTYLIIVFLTLILFSYFWSLLVLFLGNFLYC